MMYTRALTTHSALSRARYAAFRIAVNASKHTRTQREGTNRKRGTHLFHDGYEHCCRVNVGLKHWLFLAKVHRGQSVRYGVGGDSNLGCHVTRADTGGHTVEGVRNLGRFRGSIVPPMHFHSCWVNGVELERRFVQNPDLVTHTHI